MTALSATELKNRLSEAMERAQREPVMVSKSGRPYAVLVSHEEFERLQALEDRVWADRATAAIDSGDYLVGNAALRELHQWQGSPDDSAD